MTPPTSTEANGHRTQSGLDASQVLEALRCVRRMVGTTRYRRGGRHGTLQGQVEVETTAPGTVLLRTTGTWRPATGGPHLDVRDVVRWDALGRDRLRLEDRRGPGGSRRLVTLQRREGTAWTSESPHPCGEDLYDAHLHATPRQLELRWRVEGPGKHGTTLKRYRVGSAGSPRHEGT